LRIADVGFLVSHPLLPSLAYSCLARLEDTSKAL
jgi:hypothetical protein